MHKTTRYLKENREMLFALTGGLLVFFIPLSIALTNILLAPLGLLLLITFSSKEWVLQKSLPMILYATSVGVMVVLAMIKGSFLADIEIYMRYIAVIFLFLLFSKIKRTDIVENFFLGGLLIAVCIAGFKILKYRAENPDFLFDTGLAIDQVLWENRPLAAFMLVLGIFICLRKISEKSKSKWVFYFLTVLFLAFCNYISARLSLLLAIITIVYFLFFRFQISIKIKTLLAAMLFILVSIMVLFNDSLISRTPFDSKSDLDVITIAKEREPRSVIWKCASILLKTDSNAFIGIAGYEKYRQDLVNCYGETIVNSNEQRAYYMESRFNSHNQFLDFWLNGGVLPFVLLFAVFLTAFFSRKIAPDAKWIFFLFFCFFLVENVLYRQMGYYLFGIFVALYHTKAFKKIKT